MSAMKYFVPALAVAGGAFAQSQNSCSTSATLTISAAADASALSACKTFSGSIAIATGLGDPVSISGVRTITGDLVALNNSMIASIAADSLQTIGGKFELNTLQVLSTLSMPQLNSVDTILWNALAGLQLLSFTNGVQMANVLDIQNTQLQSLAGINLEVVDTVNIINNNWLNDIEMQLGNVSNTLTIASNGNNVSALFPNLIWANNMTFRSVSQLALNSLRHVNGSLGFYENQFESLQVANLTAVGTAAAAGTQARQGDLTIVSNNNLNNISFPMLKTIHGALNVQNNTELTDGSGFPMLTTIVGAFDLFGAFENASFPALNEVDGAFNLQTTAQFECSVFSHIKQISGKKTCKGAVANPSGVGSNPTSTGKAGSSGATGAANAHYVPTAAAGLMGVVAAVFGLL